MLALEELRLPFTGAASHYYEPTREQMKKVCQLFDIGAPRGVTVTYVNNLKTKIKRMQFPMIVKHPNSYGSVGLIKESRVMCFTELEAQI